MEVHPEDTIALGTSDPTELGALFDSIMTAPSSKWEKVIIDSQGKEVKVEAFVDDESGIVIINNQINPTAFIPTPKFPQEYLADDGFYPI